MNRSFLRPLLRAVLTTTVATGVVAALLTTPAHTAVAAAPADRPKAGSCHALTGAESGAASDPDAPISCDRTHTSRTFMVPTVPDRIAMDDLDALGELVSDRCTPTYLRKISRSDRARALSSYFYVWFAPTRQEIRDGARWVRCDIVLAGGPGALAPLPPAITPALRTAPHPDNVARCQLGKRKDFAITVCSKAHEYRAKGTYVMAGKKYPSERARFAEAKRRCPRITGSRSWLVSYASVASFRFGSKLAICSAKTNR